MLLGGGVAAAADYTQSVTPIDASSARVDFTPTTPALYVDIHYIGPNVGQQNFRMTNNGGTWQRTIGSLPTGFVLDYWFTYEKSGPQFDTPHFSYTHNGSSTVATPTFSPAAGTYPTAQSVTISTTTSGSSIRYTLDGSTPTASSTLYSGPISISASTTVKAIGLKAGSTNSAVATAAYVIGNPVATPTFTPPAGNYPNTQSVTISTSTAGASIRYTVDGSTPTGSSTLYTGPISVATNTTINAIGILSGRPNSAVGSAAYTIGTQAGCPAQPDVPNFGPNVRIFDPGMSAASIQAQLDTDFNNQKDTLTAQFAERRVAHLFKPGTYSGIHDDVGFYTSVAGLGQNPGGVVINGDITVDAFNASDQGVALQNFWRSAENLAVVPSSGNDRWAVAQAAPFRRMDVRGGLFLYPASFGFASGGYIADSRVSGQAASVSQQQWYTRDSQLGSWNGGVWNMVFSGTPGAPANTFPSPPETTLATTPVSRDVPYLYFDGSRYRVFLPSLRTNASGPSWASGSTPGSSLPMSQFYVVKAGDTASTINSALAAGCNLFFTPGIYHLNQTLNVTKANTVVLGIGYPTLVPDNGVNAMQVADVDGVRIKGLLFDAGTVNSAALLTVGPAGSAANHAANPTTLQDVFFRIGGQIPGKATTSLIVNSHNTIIDHTWAWRADHGNPGTFGWTVNTADTGVIVNGDNVLATGLFVEHYQKYQVIWNGQNGRTIFFQNEMPYDPPTQASWMSPNGLNGYAAYKVGTNVTTHEAWGLGSYNFFNVNPSVSAYHAFEVPNASGVRFHSLLTVSLNFQGTITHVINDTGGVTPPGTVPVNVVNYP